MAAMTRYLILCALAAAIVSRAGNAGSPPSIVQAKQIPAATPGVAKSPAPPRHLSEQERLELRRQLQQFDSQYRKRST